MLLRDYLAEWDPMGFITDLGAPQDEYGLEAADIKLKYRAGLSDEAIAALVYAVFCDRMETELPALLAECKKRASAIRDILQTDNFGL